MIGGTRVINGLDTALEFKTKGVALNQAVKSLVTHWGQLLNTKIKANASGRPGPNAPTGDYRRKWVLEIDSVGDIHTATNGNNSPQGRRLEFGFVGPDSLGRVYNQPPYPHVGPAVDFIEPKAVEGFEKLVGTL